MTPAVPPSEPPGHHRAERAAGLVLAITIVTMAIEIGAGRWTQSMALTADGWHMGMHATAMGIAVVAYRFARRHRNSGRYSFGAAKAVDLGGFANAMMLAVVALFIALESCERLLQPERVAFGTALPIAVIGLTVNLLSAWLLRGDHGHDHGHGHVHDHNREAAFIHVLSDAVTSTLTIAALFGGKRFGLVWLDPLVGLIGAGVILRWALRLARRTSAVLLDAAPDAALVASVGTMICDAGDELLELRAWPVAAGRFMLAMRVASDRMPGYADRLAALPGVVDVVIERRPASLTEAAQDAPPSHRAIAGAPPGV